MRAPGAVVLASVLAGVVSTPALAEQTIPTQDGWNDARRAVDVGGGVTLTYVQLATGDGIPLILLHGFTDNSRSWSLPAPWLGDRPIYALDLRGHGTSSAPVCCYGIDSLAHDLLGFMDAMAITQADLVGHSMGSMTAAVFAALHPARVDDLVLVSSALMVPQGANEWLWANVPALEHPIDPDSQFMLDWYWNPTPVNEDFLRRERQESAAAPRATWMGGLVGLSLMDWTGLAPRIAADTMILWGDQDALFGAAEQEALRAALPNARFETFAGMGHNMFWESPQAAGEMIAAFVAD